MISRLGRNTMICMTAKPVWYNNYNNIIVNTRTHCLLFCTPRCNVSTTELRRAAIHLLLSMLCLPLHFQDLDIKGYTANTFRKKFLKLTLSLHETCLIKFQLEFCSLVFRHNEIKAFIIYSSCCKYNRNIELAK